MKMETESLLILNKYFVGKLIKVILLSLVCVFAICKAKNSAETIYSNDTVYNNPNTSLSAFVKKAKKGMSIYEFGKLTSEYKINDHYIHLFGVVYDTIKYEGRDSIDMYQSNTFAYLIGKDTTIIAKFINRPNEDNSLAKLYRMYIVSGKLNKLGVANVNSKSVI